MEPARLGSSAVVCAIVTDNKVVTAQDILNLTMIWFQRILYMISLRALRNIEIPGYFQVFQVTVQFPGYFQVFPESWEPCGSYKKKSVHQ